MLSCVVDLSGASWIRGWEIVRPGRTHTHGCLRSHATSRMPHWVYQRSHCFVLPSSISISIAAARSLEIEPEKERWRLNGGGWYTAGISDMPGNGKLHHHLGLLSRKGDCAESIVLSRGEYLTVSVWVTVSILLL